MITLHNEKLSMRIALLGAEPQSLFAKESNIEYLWSGDKEFWPRRAPVLFPMTGPTKNNQIEASGVTYTMPNNGFARDLTFTLLSHEDSKATFLLEESSTTLSYYPYGFRLTVTYTLLEDGFKAEALVYAKDDLYFTFGWHPAFSLDINGKGTPLDSYRILFEHPERVDRKRPVDGVFVTDTNFLDGEKELLLKRKESDKGPSILNGLLSRWLTLYTDKGEHGVRVNRGNLDTLVLWTTAPKHAQYLCIEPMHSFGDTTRAFALEKMDEAMFLQANTSHLFYSSFHIF